MSYQSKKQKYEILRGQLDYERQSFKSHWQDLADYITPRRARFFVTDANRGERKNQKIIDSTATLAVRTLSSGMMSGITSPARPWFKLSTDNPSFNEIGAVKEWLHDSSQRMSAVFLKSNLYNSLPLLYKDLGTFGTGCIAVLPNDDKVIHTQSFPIGSYWIGKDSTGKVNVFMREFRMTVDQLIEQFGYEGSRDGKPVWDRFSAFVKSEWDKNNRQTWVDVRHVVMPNDEYDPRRLHSKYKKFISCYYEAGTAAGNTQSVSLTADDKLLSEKGFNYFPILCPRWEVSGEDVYATDCPGMTALGDIKQLQIGEKRAAQAIEKMVNPPMSAPISMKGSKLSTLPGDVSYVADASGQQGFKPVHEVNPRIAELEGKQEQVRQRIRKAFFEDLFLMLSNIDRRQITAREIEARHEEKLLALGPVLEQLNIDLLDPLIDITFYEMLERNMFAPIPEELKGVPLKIEYISVMAQAQKLVGISGIERFSGFVAQVAGLNPEVLDKYDLDQAIDVYGDITSIPPSLIRTDDKVAQIRQQRAKAQQAQMAPEQALQATGAIRNLAASNLKDENALSEMMKGLGR